MSVVLDTSALAAVVFGEPEAEAFLAALIREAGDLRVGAPTLVEARVVVEARQGPEALRDLLTLLSRLGVETVPFDGEQAETAVAAWRRFGKGRHPAGLNFGDCLAYAVAKSLGARLLFKGNDFAQTDIPSAM